MNEMLDRILTREYTQANNLGPINQPDTSAPIPSMLDPYILLELLCDEKIELLTIQTKDSDYGKTENYLLFSNSYNIIM